MNRAVPIDPFEELLRQSPLGCAVLLATGAQARLREAPSYPLAFLKMILLTMLIPAEALARRIILALAARLPVPAVPDKPKPTALRAPTLSKPDPAADKPRVPPFRMQEKLPRGPKPETLRTETNTPPARSRAPSALSPEEKLLKTVWFRLGAVLRALHDPDAEALRFLRRRRTRNATARPPLSFGKPPGLKGADPVLTANLEQSDRDAKSAWSRLCDTS